MWKKNITAIENSHIEIKINKTFRKIFREMQNAVSPYNCHTWMWLLQELKSSAKTKRE